MKVIFRIAAVVAFMAVGISAGAFHSEPVRPMKATPRQAPPQPAGEAVNYNKASAGTFVLGNVMSLYQDQFPATIIWSADNKVYFKNLVSVFPDDYYIEGTVSGNTITVPTGQVVENMEAEGYEVLFGVIRTFTDGEEVFFEAAPEIESITFEVGTDGSIQMVLPGEPFDGENVPEYTAGFYYSDDLAFLGYSDFYQSYTKLDMQLITMPEGADIKNYVYIDSYNYASLVEVAFHGDYLYIRGLCSMLPEATIRAKIEGDKAIVAQDEYLGVYFDMYYIFTKVLFDNPDYDEEEGDGEPFIFAPSDVGFELHIDPATGIIYADREGVYLSYHCDATDFLNSLGFFDIFELKYQATLAGTPANPVDLEYHTEWASAQGFNDFFFTLSNFSTEGTLLDVEKLYYKVFINGDPQVFQEKEMANLLGKETTVYAGVPVPVILLPYLFNNNEDVFKFNDNAFDIGIYTDNVETIGVQTVYYYDDVFTYSDIVTLDVESGEITVTDGIADINDDSEITGTDYYTLDGLKTLNPEKGLFIRVDRLRNGSVKTRKVVF